MSVSTTSEHQRVSNFFAWRVKAERLDADAHVCQRCLRPARFAIQSCCSFPAACLQEIFRLFPNCSSAHETDQVQWPEFPRSNFEFLDLHRRMRRSLLLGLSQATRRNELLLVAAMTADSIENEIAIALISLKVRED